MIVERSAFSIETSTCVIELLPPRGGQLKPAGGADDNTKFHVDLYCCSDVLGRDSGFNREQIRDRGM